jgi:histidinol-phosphate aminotransferase
VYTALRAAGWVIPEPQGNFVWLPVRDDAASLGVDLERRGVVTRAFAEVGVRVTIATPEWNDRFLAALADARPTPAC